MPTRRGGWRGGLAGLGQGIGDLSMLLLQQRLLQKRQDENNRQAALRQLLDDARLDRRAMSNPDFVAKHGAQRAGVVYNTMRETVPEEFRSAFPDIPFSALDLTRAEKVAPIHEGINEGKFADLPTEGIESSIRAMFEANRAPVRNQVTMDATEPQIDLGEHEDFRTAVNLAQARRQEKLDVESREAVERMVNGVKEQVYLTEREQGQGQEGGPLTFRTERTPEEERARNKAEAEGTALGGLTPEVIQGSANKEAAVTGARERAQLAPDIVAGQVNRAGRMSAAQEDARLSVYFNPKYIEARNREATAQAMREAQLAQSKEHAAYVAETSRAVAQLTPVMDKLTPLALRLSQGRMAGAAQELAFRAGKENDVFQLRQLLQANKRAFARAFGFREANLSDTEAQSVVDGLGLSSFNTRGETQIALRNLRDAITVGPVVAARLGANANLTVQMETQRQLIHQRQQAEDAAIKAGANAFLDPVTNAISPVIR